MIQEQMTTETIDVFSEDMQPLSPAAVSIDDVHKKGLWHQTFACWLVNPAQKTIFLQKRGPRNRIDPGSYDATASGHLFSGETPSDGFREFKEETGIDIAETDRLYIGSFRNMATRGSYINNELCHVFLARTYSQPDFSPEPGEVLTITEFSIHELLDVFTGQKSFATSLTPPTDGNHPLTLYMHDMCNFEARTTHQEYYANVMKCAQKWAADLPDVCLNLSQHP